MTDTRPSTESNVDTGDSGGGERTAINDFEFQVCSRCGHPPSDGPCIMGNEEHAETWPKRYAAYHIAAEQADALHHAHQELEGLRAAVRQLGPIPPRDLHYRDGAYQPGSNVVVSGAAWHRLMAALSPAPEGQEPE